MGGGGVQYKLLRGRETRVEIIIEVNRVKKSDVSVLKHCLTYSVVSQCQEQRIYDTEWGVCDG